MRCLKSLFFAGVLVCASGYQFEARADGLFKFGHSKKSTTVRIRPVTTRPAKKIHGHPISDQLGIIYARTTNTFQTALLYKPDENAPYEQRQFATLLVQETPKGGSARDSLRIGIVNTDESAQASVDITHPTVYTADSHVIFGDTYCQQRIYLWAYPGDDGKGVVWRGVRTTYGPNQYPLIWELLGEEGQPNVLFVCKTLERAAEREYGKPLTGRQSSIERSLDQQPNIVVARALPPGNDPAGPMVYLDAADKTVTTLLCRCMPPQFSNTAETVYYQMLPLDILGNVQIAADGPFRLIKSTTPQVGKGGQPWLETVLRMPSRF